MTGLPASLSDTIVAIATPIGAGAIGVVRLSGNGATTLLRTVWKSNGTTDNNFVTRRIYYGNITDLSTAYPHRVIDEVLMAYFQAPHSYTGEDVIEVYGHGNPYLLEQIVAQFVRVGARHAAPGEFTQRAYLNGRIDLAQAEAVADLIAATNANAHRYATEQLAGRLSREVRNGLDAVTRVRAFVEATIDFPEEDLEMITRARIAEQVDALAQSLGTLAATYQEGRLYREGARVVLAGLSNAGKSSLFNALLGEDRAIVHHEPGTTRDVIEDVARIDGITCRIIDTAGLRETGASAVESLGIERTQRQIVVADLLLMVIDGSVPFLGKECVLVGGHPPERMVVALNKSDLPLVVSRKMVAEVFPSAAIVSISATHSEGLSALRAAMVTQLRQGKAMESEGVTVTNGRHKAALDRAVTGLDGARAALHTGQAPEFIAEHLRQVSEALGAIVGTVTTDDLLREIFSHFCIGK